MRYSEIINELFDNNSNIEFIETPEGVVSEFHVDTLKGKVRYDVEFYKITDGEYDVQFVYLGTEDQPEEPSVLNMNVMGNKSIRVFSKVISTMKKFVQVYKPERLTFIGYKEDGRDVLYRKLIASLFPNNDTKESNRPDKVKFVVNF